MKSKMSKQCALALSAALVVSLVCPSTMGTESQAAAKIKLSTKSVTLNTGKSKKVSVKGVTAKKVRKIVWKTSSKRTATVKKSGKLAAKVTGKKAGKAKVTARVYLKKKKKPQTLRLSVTVKKVVKESAAPVTTPAAITPSVAPSASSTPIISNTQAPATSSPVADETPRTPGSILEAYDGIFDNMGVCANYYGYGVKTDQLRTDSTLNFIKKHYNSITLENEMKPDSVLGNWSASGYTVKKITVAQAKQKGYYIPDNYSEENVPQLNLDTVDATLETLKANNLKMRAHTLMWHQQTPSWFFTENYNGTTKVDAATMNARLEFFVRTVMRHVMDKEKQLTGTNGDLIYAWDVTNEYIHRFHDAASITWTDVYGDQGLQSTYVKKAFEIAYEELERYGVADEVVLYYNDYDTYDCADEIIELVNYINEGATNAAGNPVNICGGIGMQSHITVDYPGLEAYGAALDKFLATGLEVSITELDVSINYDRTGKQDAHGFDIWSYTNKGQTDEDQAKFMKDFMELLVTRQKNRDVSVNPRGIVGVTIWGLFDSCSWKADTAPLLFGNSINNPKASYDSFIAASDIWYKN